METLPVDRLHHANVVVRDLKTTARNYAQLLGINSWDVVHHTEERLSATSVHGFGAPYTYSSATGSNSCGVTFRLIQPIDGFSTFTEFLLARGPGCMVYAPQLLMPQHFQNCWPCSGSRASR